MLQSPETEILILCARPQLGNDAVSRILSLLQQELDWQLIFQLAEYHRSIPLLAFHLHHHATGLLSSDIQTELQEHHRNSTQHNMVLALEVLRIIDLFSAEGIHVIPFKGPVSAMLVHGDMAKRACGDIDLLVKQSDHGKAEHLLENEGYAVKIRYQDAMQSSLQHEQRRISVDLHWGIPPEEIRLNSDRLWENLKPINLLGRPVLTFSPCDTLLVTATNAVKEYWAPSLHHLSDITALTSSYTNEDWLEAVRRAREIGCQRVLVAAILFTHRLLNSPLSSVGPTQLFSHQGINKVVDDLQDHLFLQLNDQAMETALKPIHHRDMRSYYSAITDSMWQRNRSWMKWVVTPNVADKTFVKLPRALSFLYFFIRPLRLLRKYL
jgi:hypothetical protein